MRYLTSWEEICKVADREKIERFNSIFEQIQIVLTLEGAKDVCVEDIFPYFVDYSSCHYANELIEISDKVNELREAFNDIIYDFHRKTNIMVFLDLIAIDDASYYSDFDSNERTEFVLPMEQMVQLTPKAKKLSQKITFWDAS
jgi:hypothetical protein